MLVGYAWVSTREQNQALQLDAPPAAGCGRVYVDTASGARRAVSRRNGTTGVNRSLPVS